MVSYITGNTRNPGPIPHGIDVVVLAAVLIDHQRTVGHHFAFAVFTVDRFGSHRPVGTHLQNSHPVVGTHISHVRHIKMLDALQYVGSPHHLSIEHLLIFVRMGRIDLLEGQQLQGIGSSLALHGIPEDELATAGTGLHFTPPYSPRHPFEGIVAQDRQLLFIKGITRSQEQSSYLGQGR